jgi:hypothetical protein
MTSLASRRNPYREDPRSQGAPVGSGALTQEEFDKKKTELLGQM